MGDYILAPELSSDVDSTWVEIDPKTKQRTGNRMVMSASQNHVAYYRKTRRWWTYLAPAAYAAAGAGALYGLDRL